jgi:low temperature requirement protein LtrA
LLKLVIATSYERIGFMKPASPSKRSVIAPENQSATFVELFFDLVFVFSVTQVVGLLHHGFTWTSVGQAVLVFWLVWWAWTQFTWALNAADTTHHWVGFGTLLATAVAFFMAIALPEAFDKRSLWFATTYALVRIIGLIIYVWVSWQDRSQRLAVRTFGLLSLGGLLVVLLGGYLGGSAQYGLWGLAILLDIIAASIGGRSEGWNLHPEHFAERHGLFVIIALGETLIVTGSGVTSKLWTADLMVVATLAVLCTCGLWWSYFQKSKPVLEHALERTKGAKQAELGRDVFSLFHFPMLLGVIAFSYAVEEAVAHPSDSLSFVIRLALALGLTLFLGGMVVAMWRATQLILWLRLVLTLITALTILFFANINAGLSLGIAFTGILLIVILEQWFRVFPHTADS